MSFKPIFFYDDDANKGGGGGDQLLDDKTDLTNVADKISDPLFTDDELKGFGFDSPETAKTRIAELIAKSKEDSKTEEDRKKEEFVEKTNFLKFSAENKLLEEKDYSQYESLKSKEDRDLVFEKYCQEEKEDDSTLTDDELKRNFEQDYKLTNENEKVKTRGLSRIEKEAKDIRSPFENKVETAKSKYNEGKQQTAEETKLREIYPSFDKFINEQISKLTPDKVILSKTKEGETEIPIEVDLTKEDKEAINKLFRNHKYFNQFNKGETKELEAAINKKVDGWIKVNKFDSAIEKTKETFKGIGTASGSTTGAKNSFALAKNSNQPDITEIKDAKAAVAEDDMKLRQRLKVQPH